MSKKILAFGASSSKNSINKQLATFAVEQIQEAEVTVLDLNDFEMPIYSIDKETENGIPQLAMDFKKHIKEADGIVISFAEHNGAYSAAFKNIFDWISRIEKDVWGNKPMFLMATSPGARGGKSVLDIAVNKFTRMTTSPVSEFSLPSYYENFSEEKGIIDKELKHAFDDVKAAFEKAIFS